MRRPTAVTIGVPYLGLLWAGFVSWTIANSFGDGLDDASSQVTAMVLWTVVWGATLYRVWRGGPFAIRAVAVLATVIPGVLIVGVGLIAVMMRDTFDGAGPFGKMQAGWWLALGGYIGAFIVGVGLRRPNVREWSAVLHPPRTRAQAALRQSGQLRTGPPSPSAPFTRRPVPDGAEPHGAESAGTATIDDARADNVQPGGAEPAGTSPVEPGDTSLDVDLAEKLRGHAKFRIGCFGVGIAFFGVIALVILVESLRGDEDWIPAVSMGGFVLVLILALVISVRRFGGRLGTRSELTIDRTGITWRGTHDLAQFSWNGLAGVGISYHMATTKNGKKMHMPQLDVFEQVSSPVGRWAELDRRRREERPPEPHLPNERYRLMLPVDDGVHRAIEAAVLEHRPALWLGWYERSRSDTPWFLR
ncbi:hypothetical protein [Phytoactinopolyspora endophytica]|uniref:hypothetical protein n=1 Tax=Phytoactinopolyspora endophytica TaxID=1642495 RepID=UPI00101D14AA|nr:hypothetical protein [Phytoactinopolyspora endophytica]